MAKYVVEKSERKRFAVDDYHAPVTTIPKGEGGEGCLLATFKARLR